MAHSTFLASTLRAVLAGLLTVLCGPAALAANIFPDDYPSIQAAIDAAAVGDTVLVRPGTYVENLNYGGKDVVVRSTDGYPSTTIDGGQNGTVVVFENGETPAAVLDGFTITGGVGTVRPAGGIHCGHASPTIRRCLIVGNRGVDGQSAAGGMHCGFASPDVRNCIFRRNIGGSAEVSHRPAGPGALRVRWDSYPTFVSTVFEENRGASRNAGSGAGGAGVLYTEQNAEPVFNSCEFIRNEGGSQVECNVDGGAGVASIRGTATFRECTFQENHAGRGAEAGGVASIELGLVFFTSSTFVGNTGGYCATDEIGSGQGAGAIYARSASVQVNDCVFTGNRGEGRGAPGAIHVQHIGSSAIVDSTFEGNVGGFGGTGAAGAVRFDETFHSPSRIEGCTFEGNVGGGGRRGGPGAVMSLDSGLLVDCLFVANRGGDGYRGDGGAGALRCGDDSILDIDACTFLDNLGGVGSHDGDDTPNSAQGGVGAILSTGGEPEFTNCVVARNVGGSSNDYAPGTGAVEVTSGALSFVSSTVVDNVAGTGPGANKPSGLRLGGGGSHEITNTIFWDDVSAPEVMGSAELRHCIVRGGYTGPGNLDVDPLLVDRAGDDFHLGCASPARDAGDTIPGPPQHDYEGDPRVVGASVDIGADEYALPAAGSSYCVSTPNSTGTAALIDAAGCNALSDGYLPLRAGPVPDTFGAFFYGPSQLQVPFGNGFRCVGGAVYRLPFVAITNGELVDRLDYASPPQPAGRITAGSTWYFQAYYRDPAAGGAQVDLSDGLQVTFVP